MVRIPNEYQEVEWIGSTDDTGQYINSGVNVSDTIIVKAKFNFPSKKSYASAFGGKYNGFCLSRYQNREYFVVQIYGSSTNITNFGYSQDKWVDIELSTTQCSLNGTLFQIQKGTSVSSTSIWLFGKANSSGTALDVKNACKISYFQIFDENVLVRNFIPCYRKSDNEPGMYDTVSKTFYINSGTGTFLVGNDVSWDTASLLERRRQILLNTPHIETVSGSMASFDTDISANLKECKVYFSPVQEGTGDPSPDNVRPISGWDGVSVSHSISDDIYVYNDVTPNNSTYLTKINNNSFRVYTKAKVEYPSSKQPSTSLGFVSGKKYRIEFDISVATLGEGHHINFGFRNNVHTFQTGYVVRCDTDGHYAFEFAFTNTTDLNYLSLCQVVSGKEYFDATISNLKIYEIETITIPFNRTIYGGYVDLVRSEVVEMMEYLDLNDISFELNQESKRAYWSPPSNKYEIPARGDYPEAIAEEYSGRPVALTGFGSGNFAINITGQFILYYDGENVPSGKMIIKLKNFNAYTLTPETIKALKGINNIWSNANGNVEVSYYSH